jgi:uncharacterized membrane protein YccC
MLGVDYANQAMDGDKDLHRKEGRHPADADSATAGQPDVNGQLGGQDRTIPPHADGTRVREVKSVEASQLHPQLNKWQTFWQGIVHIDTAKMEPWIGLRNAAGVVIPLAVGVAIGMPLGGLAVASGALNVSYSDGHDPYGQRAKRMLASSALCAIAIMAGGLAGHHNAAAIVLATVWAFGSGMAITLGATAESLGVISVVLLIIYSAQSLTPARTLQAGALAFAGGVIQTLLSLALWPVRGYEPERRALAHLYLSLAQAASSPEQLMKAPPAVQPSTAAQEALAARVSDHSIESERFVSLLSQGERIHLRLFTLGRLLRRMRREKFGFAPAEMVDSFLESAAHVMTAIGESLIRNSPLTSNESWMNELRTTTDALRASDEAGDRTFLAAVISDARFQLDALAGQLRAAAQLAGDVTPAGLEATRQRDKRLPWRRRFSGNLARVTANLSLQSAICRHATRLSAAVALAEVTSRHLENPRAYWLPMTTVLVLKPEFTVTFTRGLLRIAGTIAGLLLATALFHFLSTSKAVEIVLIGAFVFLLRWAGPANYGIFGVAVSALVVLLIAFTGVSPRDVILLRGINTIAGGLLALAAYAAWPTWERTQVGVLMARLIEAYHAYFAAVVDGVTRTDFASAAQRIDKARLAARLARSNAVASVDRMRVEPGTRAEEGALLSAMLVSSHRFVHAVMSVEAATLAGPHPPVRSEFVAFAADVLTTLDGLARLLRQPGSHVQKWLDLREDHRRLIQSQEAAGEQYALVNVEADRMANSLNTLREQMEKWRRLR